MTNAVNRQQERGVAWDIIDQAINAYNGYMLDDDFDAATKLNAIMKTMRERRDLCTDAARVAPPPAAPFASQRDTIAKGADDAERAQVLCNRLITCIWSGGPNAPYITERGVNQVTAAFTSIRAGIAAEHEKAMAELRRQIQESAVQYARAEAERKAAEARALTTEAAVVGLREGYRLLEDRADSGEWTLPSTFANYCRSVLTSTAPLAATLTARLRQEGAREEREACAKIADAHAIGEPASVITAHAIATAIRALEAGAKPQGEG